MSGTVAVCLLPGSDRYLRAERRTRLCTGPLLGDHGLSALEPKKTAHRMVNVLIDAAGAIVPVLKGTDQKCKVYIS
jgi:hypothetical protein